jgi:hypothetical protein
LIGFNGHQDWKIDQAHYFVRTSQKVELIRFPLILSSVPMNSINTLIYVKPKFWKVDSSENQICVVAGRPSCSFFAAYLFIDWIRLDLLQLVAPQDRTHGRRELRLERHLVHGRIVAHQKSKCLIFFER